MASSLGGEDYTGVNKQKEASQMKNILQKMVRELCDYEMAVVHSYGYDI